MSLSPEKLKQLITLKSSFLLATLLRLTKCYAMELIWCPLGSNTDS